MLERHSNAQRANELANHPSIFPYIQGHSNGAFDLTETIKNPKNICLVGEYGSVLFLHYQPGIYGFHTNVLPEGRGEWMVKGSEFAFNWMFTKTDAYELMTQCPRGNVAAKAGARAVGCSNVFITRPLWPVNGNLVEIEVYSLLIQHWIKTAKNISQSGKWFHEDLENQCKALGKNTGIHPEDDEHNRYVGATVEMIRSGYVLKAISFYNRWAILAGYKLVNLLSLEPLVIDIGDCKLQIEENGFKVM